MLIGSCDIISSFNWKLRLENQITSSGVGHHAPKWVGHHAPKRVGHHAPKRVGHHAPK